MNFVRDASGCILSNHVIRWLIWGLAFLGRFGSLMSFPTRYGSPLGFCGLLKPETLKVLSPNPDSIYIYIYIYN